MMTLSSFQSLACPSEYREHLSLCSGQTPAAAAPTVKLVFLGHRVCAFVILLLLPNTLCRIVPRHLPTSLSICNETL